METFDLQRFRKDVGVTQKQLAELLDVPQSFISQVETRKSAMPRAWEDVLASTYNITNISDYITTAQDQNNTFNDVSGVAGIGVSVNNDLNELLKYLKSHDEIIAEQLRNRDEIIIKSQNQIDRLIDLLAKEH